MHLNKAVRGARALQEELEELKRQNTELKQRLEHVEHPDQPKRGRKGGPTLVALQGTIRELNSRIRDLEKARRKDKKKIDKLRIREAKADATELQDDAELDVGDTAHTMRKLLRRFHDTIVSTSIEENEECPICMDTLQVHKCTSLPCEHTFCESCVSKVSPGSEVITCPQCRKLCRRDEIEIVQFTASQQWDALLEIAKAWAKVDLLRQEDTSEEEAEEQFIDDEPPDADVSSVRSALTGRSATSPEPEVQHNGADDKDDEPPISSNPAKKRRIAFSPESSPLSQPPSPQTEEMPQSKAGMSQFPTETISNQTAAEEDVAGPSNGTTLTPQGTPLPSTSQPSPPSYIQSPASEKRKRLKSLAARKRKR